jgi:hypothetical protein
MSSSEERLQIETNDVFFDPASDDDRLRDAGDEIRTTLHSRAGCRPDEAEPKACDQTQSDVGEPKPAGCWSGKTGTEHADAASPGLLSVNAKGGMSDALPSELKTPAESIRSLRDFEAFLRNSGFSRSDARAIAKGGWQAIGEDKSSAIDDLADMIRAQTEELKRWMSPS